MTINGFKIQNIPALCSNYLGLEDFDICRNQASIVGVAVPSVHHEAKLVTRRPQAGMVRALPVPSVFRPINTFPPLPSIANTHATCFGLIGHLQVHCRGS
jgi:hypothetical protein